MDDNEVDEKRLELAIEKLVQQLISDLNTVEDKNRITNSNFSKMQECFNSLSKAEYHIVSALCWSRGVDPKKYSNPSHNLFDALKEAFKKTK